MPGFVVYSLHGCYQFLFLASGGTTVNMERTADAAMVCCCSRFTGLQQLQSQCSTEQMATQPTVRSLWSCRP